MALEDLSIYEGEHIGLCRDTLRNTVHMNVQGLVDLLFEDDEWPGVMKEIQEAIAAYKDWENSPLVEG